MNGLSKYGVTNDRLDEVSNYYRFRPQAGELWPTRPAKGYALIEDGKIKKLVIANPGAGYNTPPEVTLPDFPTLHVRATLSFNKDLKKNGGVATVEQAPASTK